MRCITLTIALCWARIALGDPFTGVSNTVSWQATNIVNEYVLSVFERYGASYGSYAAAFTNVVTGDVIQLEDFWGTNATPYGLQEALITMAPSFVDHTTSLSGSAAVTYFTVSNWYNEAGISNGFRRATSWNPSADDWTVYTNAMFRNGIMQTGDIIGPWIFADLAAAISALKWTYSGSAVVSNGVGRRATGNNNVSCDSCEDTIPTNSWSLPFSDLYYCDDEDYLYSAHAYGISTWIPSGDYCSPYTNYYFVATRQCASNVVFGACTNLTADVDMYFKFKAQAVQYATGGGGCLEQSCTYTNLDAIAGAGTPNVWVPMTNAVAYDGSGAVAITNPLSLYYENPIVLLSVGCPANVNKGIGAEDGAAIFKWDFSYSN